ncbi:hypothetical protein CKA32_000541 [Geitlerinema sp. FC II]|nr:hypothetical protein CKA32_000541 [Geitlerinema sp. FC II]
MRFAESGDCSLHDIHSVLPTSDFYNIAIAPFCKPIFSSEQ